MPLVAQHAALGLLDATQPDLGKAGACWADLHRARPRPELRCSDCGHRVHAKVSPAPRRLRFFAHDSASPGCALNGETMAHRLLKLELASAVRAAGWVAELEAAGPGFRADVLAISPNGLHRVVWEAQLAAISVDEIRRRTATITASGAGVCWVTDRIPAWLGSVPAIALRAGDGEDHTVISGVVRLTHDYWQPPKPPLTLGAFVELVCQQRVSVHRPCLPIIDRSSRVMRDAELVWTAPTYIARERALLERSRAEDRAMRTWRENINALQERQRQLLPWVIGWVARETGQPAQRLPTRRGPRWGGGGGWAGGVPVVTSMRVRALICPVPHRLENWSYRALLLVITIVAASEAEAARVLRVCPAWQHIMVVDPETGVSLDYSGRRPWDSPDDDSEGHHAGRGVGVRSDRDVEQLGGPESRIVDLGAGEAPGGVQRRRQP